MLGKTNALLTLRYCHQVVSPTRSVDAIDWSSLGHQKAVWLKVSLHTYWCFKPINQGTSNQNICTMATGMWPHSSSGLCLQIDVTLVLRLKDTSIPCNKFVEWSNKGNRWYKNFWIYWESKKSIWFVSTSVEPCSRRTLASVMGWKRTLYSAWAACVWLFCCVPLTVTAMAVPRS